MPAYILNIRRNQSGTRLSTGVVDKAVTTEAQVNSLLARNPDNISVQIDVATEAQIRGLLQYAQAIDQGTDTSSVETAISAII